MVKLKSRANPEAVVVLWTLSISFPYLMAGSVISNSGKRIPNLWKEAYSALRDDDKGKDRLDKLNAILRKELDKPHLKLHSNDGYKQLQTLIRRKSESLSAKRASEKVSKICDNMLAIKDIVAAGAGVGGPYVAIPAAALFLAFSVRLHEAGFARAKVAHEISDAANISIRKRRDVRAR
jgi:hypothetical protein